MVTTPWGALLGIVVMSLFLFKEQIRELVSTIVKQKAHSFGKNKYGKKDVLNHPIFRDLDYWLNKGIDLVKIDKSYAKELIMKDVLRVKFNVIKDLLLKNINTNTIDSIADADLNKLFTDVLRDIDTNQLIGWRASGIPEIFIKKYIITHSFGREIVKNTIKVFMSGSVDVDNYTKCYLSLSILDSQLTNIYANAVSTALSLNGDLNGIIYKGVVIGSSRTYTIDNPVSQEMIESRLTILLSALHASRAGVVLFHDYPGEDPLGGKFSLVYEICAPGISNDKDDLQYMPSYLLSSWKDKLKNNEVISGTLFSFDYGVGKLMRENGTEILVAYPIKDSDGFLKGLIKLNWVSKNKFESDTKDMDLKKILDECSEDIKKLLLGYK